MKLNIKKYFELAKENGFESADLYQKHAHNLSVSIYHGEIDSLTQNDTNNVLARGIINGKFGSASTELIDKNTPEFLIKSIQETASIIENDDPTIIYKGSPKYHKKNVYNKDALAKNVDDKIQILFEIEKKLRAFDKRINDVVGVSYEEGMSEIILSNSFGLKLSQKDANYCYVAQITVKEGEELRSGYKVFASLDPNEFNVDNFIKELAEETLAKLGAVQCESKSYPLILNQDCSSILLKSLLQSIDAEEVQKHSSLLEGKLNQKIVSKKISICENPLKKSIFFRYFDDEGVAINKKDLVKNGVLKTYLYTLQTAMKDGVEPTGNGYRSGSKAYADTGLLIVKPGKKSEKDIISEIQEGVYINDLQGLHSGLNTHSGNFSLQASGFMIRNGKLAEPLSLITVADNLLTLFDKVKDVSSDSKLIYGSEMECPSIFFTKVAVSGK